MKKLELLAPCGNFGKLQTALYFGADAVYLGGKNFSLRSYSDNFTDDELSSAVKYVHENGKKVYVTANIFAKNIALNINVNVLIKFFFITTPLAPIS